ncbi:MAG: DUF6273 domain-containing protein [Erysipelotrichaceae bacterium]|nr:DUF6273 domain-containing protein [Erysipelotrichaceae bacterium]
MKKDFLVGLTVSMAALSCVAIVAASLWRDKTDAKTSVLGLEVDENGLFSLGTYPQSVLSDGCDYLVPHLDAITTPNEHGYLEFQGSEYVRVVATPNSANTVKFNNGETIIPGGTYYFKVEPIKWRVLDAAKGLLLCEDILDAAGYNPATPEWEQSPIRYQLNEYFLDTAFESDEEPMIKHSIITESGVSTELHLFHLSRNDYATNSYGFDTMFGSADPDRVAKTSEYARAIGLYSATNTNATRYFTRSVMGSQTIAPILISETGTYTTYASGGHVPGIRPAIYLQEPTPAT